MSRERQLWYLVGLTAITLAPAYTLQGWLASGHSATDIHTYFWYFESAAWLFRALVEAWAIVYLFKTSASTTAQSVTLWVFKVLLIALITATLGPTMYAAGLQSTINQVLSGGWFWLWNFAIASYAPLMLGAVGVAYKIQPDNAQPDNSLTVQPVQPDKPLTKPIVQPIDSVKPVAVQSDQPVIVQPDNLTDRDRQLLAFVQDDPAVSVAELSRRLNVSRTTATGYIKRLTSDGVLSKNGNGWKVRY